MNRTALTLLAASLACLAPAANSSSGSKSSATLSNLQVSIVNLDPTSTAAPTFSIDGLFSYTQVYNASEYLIHDGNLDAYTAMDADNFARVSAPADALAGATELSKATAPADFSGVTQNAATGISGTFTLSPGAALVFTADAWDAAQDADGLVYTAAYSYIAFQVGSGASYVNDNDTLAAISYLGTVRSRQLHTTVFNLGDAVMTGYINAGTQVMSYADGVVPIPEADSGWMVAAGLGWVCMALRRRRSAGPTG